MTLSLRCRGTVTAPLVREGGEGWGRGERGEGMGEMGEEEEKQISTYVVFNHHRTVQCIRDVSGAAQGCVGPYHSQEGSGCLHC